jgi:hypothetical protein
VGEVTLHRAGKSLLGTGKASSGEFVANLEIDEQARFFGREDFGFKAVDGS